MQTISAQTLNERFGVQNSAVTQRPQAAPTQIPPPAPVAASVPAPEQPRTPTPAETHLRDRVAEHLNQEARALLREHLISIVVGEGANGCHYVFHADGHITIVPATEPGVAHPWTVTIEPGGNVHIEGTLPQEARNRISGHLQTLGGGYTRTLLRTPGHAGGSSLPALFGTEAAHVIVESRPQPSSGTIRFPATVTLTPLPSEFGRSTPLPPEIQQRIQGTLDRAIEERRQAAIAEHGTTPLAELHPSQLPPEHTPERAAYNRAIADLREHIQRTGATSLLHIIPPTEALSHATPEARTRARSNLVRWRKIWGGIPLPRRG